LKVTKIGFGGGCHWCTEAVFQVLIGVEHVAQGWIASDKEHISFSEAVIVTYNPALIALDTLIQVHLLTHKSTVSHSIREKYRSAVYTYTVEQTKDVADSIAGFQEVVEQKIITKVLPFKTFKGSREAIQNYYNKNPNKPFCKTYINPKLKSLLSKFSKQVKTASLDHLKEDNKFSN